MTGTGTGGTGTGTQGGMTGIGMVTSIPGSSFTGVGKSEPCYLYLSFNDCLGMKVNFNLFKHKTMHP